MEIRAFSRDGRDGRSGPARTLGPRGAGVPVRVARGAVTGARRRARGFTLVEALVVVALLAILAAVAAPSFGTLMADQRVKSVTQDLQTLFLFARAEAVYKRTETGIAADDRKWEAKAGDEVLREAVVSDAVTVQANDDDGVLFGPAGNATLAGGGNPPYRVTVSATDASWVHCLAVTRAGLVQHSRVAAGGTCS